MSLCERTKLEITQYKMVLSSSENSSVVNTPAVNSAIGEQDDDEAINCHCLFDCGVPVVKQLSDLLNNNWSS